MGKFSHRVLGSEGDGGIDQWGSGILLQCL